MSAPVWSDEAQVAAQDRLAARERRAAEDARWGTPDDDAGFDAMTARLRARRLAERDARGCA